MNLTTVGVAYPTWSLIILWSVVFVLSSLTILGNLMVLVSYYVERSIRQQTSNYFLASLAVSDLIIGIEGFPILSIYVTYGEHWVIGKVSCELWLCIDYTVCLVSILTVLLITVDRYCSVCYPAFYRLWLNLRKVQFLIVLSWFLPTGLFFTTILGWEWFTGEPNNVEKDLRCEVPFLQNAYVNMALYLTYYWAVLIAIIVLYHGIHKAAAALEDRGRVRDRQNLFISTQLNMAQMGAFLGGSGRNRTHPAPTPTPVDEDGPAMPVTISVAPNILEPESASPISHQISSGSQERLKLAGNDSQHRLFIPRPSNYGTFVKSETLVELSPRRPSGAEVNLVRTQSQNVKARPFAQRVLHAVNSVGSKISMISMFYREGSEFTLADAFGEMSLSSVTKNAYAESQVMSTNGSSNTHCSLFDDLEMARPDRCFFVEDEFEIEDIDEECGTDGDALPRCPVILTPNPGILTPNPGILTPNPGTPRFTIDSEEDSAGTVQKDVTTEVQISSTENDTLLVDSIPFDSLNQAQVQSSNPSSPWPGYRSCSDRGSNDPDQRSNEPDQPQGGSPELPRPRAPPSSASEYLLYPRSTNNNSSNKSRTLSPDQTHDNELDDDNLSKIEDLNDLPPPTDPKGGFASVMKFMKDRKLKQTRAERRAKKAFRTITIIVGAFAILWSPYYIVATVYGFCSSCVPSPVFVTSYYMCYINSLMNPICYAMANLNFRRCFLRLMRGDFQRK